jgi:hypothetical protein
MRASSLDLAGVESHAHLDLLERPPVLLEQRKLRRCRGLDGGGRIREGRVNRIPDGLEDDAVVSVHGPGEELVMPSDQPPVVGGVLLEEPRAPLDVREEEGDAAFGQVLATGNGLRIVGDRLCRFKSALD